MPALISRRASLLASWPRACSGRRRQRSSVPTSSSPSRSGATAASATPSICRAPATSCCSTPRWPGPALRPRSCLAAAGDECALVIAFSSGLKLDQAGLELANVGIVRRLVRDGAPARPDRRPPRQLRGLAGAGLTLDELSALSAPWFMDRAYADTIRRPSSPTIAHWRRRSARDSPVFGAALPSLADRSVRPTRRSAHSAPRSHRPKIIGVWRIVEQAVRATRAAA